MNGCGWEKLPGTLAVVREGIERGLHPAVQLHVRRYGSVVADAALGEAQPGVPLTPDSVTLWMSAGKPLTALAVMRLFQEGLLAPDQPVAAVLPEFAAGGKAGITLEHLLTHTGGFRPADRVADDRGWEATLAAICATPLEDGWVPGETAGYHLNGSWFVLGEVLRRVTGLPADEAVRQAILQPLGLAEVWLGIPEGVQEALGSRLAWAWVTEDNRREAHPFLNDPGFRARCRPGSGARGPVRELARLYEALLDPGAAGLSGEWVRWATGPRRVGRFDRTFKAVVNLGAGFIRRSDPVDGRRAPYGYGDHAGPDTFGHSGAQSSCAFADPAHGLVVAWVCTGMPGEPAHQRRQRAINTAIYRDLGLAGAVG